MTRKNVDTAAANMTGTKARPGQIEPSERGFYAAVKEALAGLETLRLEKLAQYNWRKKIAIPAAVILTPVCGYIDWLLILWQRGQDDTVAGLTVALLGGLYAWVTQPKRQYAKGYKKEVLPKIAAYVGDLVYRPKGRVGMKVLKPSKIVPDHDRYETEDYFEGTYKGVTLKFSEAELTERRGSGKHRRNVTVFKGLIILIDMAETKFYGHTILTKDRAAIFEWFKEKNTELKRADLVDPEFEGLFDVYTNDQVEARYLIDPVMIERIKGLYEEYEGQKLAAAYYEGKMLIMIGSKDNHFEPAGLHVPATDAESVLSLKREVAQILKIIDYLKLYTPNRAHRDHGASHNQSHGDKIRNGLIYEGKDEKKGRP